MKKTKSIEMATTPKHTHNLFTLKNLLPCKHKFASTFGWLRRKAVAFTMAEILLSLAVIGIIAAMTLPTLTANFQDRAFNAKRQALHARLANALRTLEFEEYIPLGKLKSLDGGDEYVNIQKFMNDLSKEINIKRISEPEMIFSNSGDEWSTPIGNNSRVPFAGSPIEFFQTVNGESIGILFNRDVDKSDKNDPGRSFIFVLVYDLNGQKGPNRFGKDLGIMGAFYYENVELYAPMLGAITSDLYNPDDGNGEADRLKYPDYRPITPEEFLTLHSNGISQISETTLICPLYGSPFSASSLYHWNSSTEDDSESCLNLLVTNDGSAPKNGVVVDINE